MCQLLTNVLEGLNNNEIVTALLLDLSKAFDSCDNNTLLNKLHKMGFRGKSIEQMTSYLNPRFQRVQEDIQPNEEITKNECTRKHKNNEQIELRKTYSDWIKIDRSVQQGSIQGPLMFILYINELPKLLNHLFFFFF